jgi:hypothetical protein
MYRRKLINAMPFAEYFEEIFTGSILSLIEILSTIKRGSCQHLGKKLKTRNNLHILWHDTVFIIIDIDKSTI